jgi:homoserine dehydrogenase
MAEIREVPIILLGLGNVGRALLRQILDTRDLLAQRSRLRVLVTALADSRAVLFQAGGLSDAVVADVLRAKTDGTSLSAWPSSLPASCVTDATQPGAIMVDLTASTATASLLQTALAAGCGVVLANKHPLTGPSAQAGVLLEHPHVRYETTVGAGLPAIASLRTLLATGDQLTTAEGCLSGTLGYICTQLQDGVPYSDALSQARELGYTEPDPREDLSGRDVARKALILARTAGWPLEMADLVVEPMYSKALAAISIEEFLAATADLNAPYARRVREAQAQGQVLRYVAHVTPEGGQVKLAAVGQDSLLGALRGPGNYLAFHTRRYAAEPLVISGPGAGREVTAAGVFGDIIDLALHHKDFGNLQQRDFTTKIGHF